MSIAALTVRSTITKPDKAGAVCRITVATDDVLRAFGRRGRVAVVATFPNGYALRSSLVPRGGAHMLPLSVESRVAGDLTEGESVRVELREDREPRELEIPSDLANALEVAGVDRAFGAMSFSHRKEWIVALADAKRPETRAKRIAACVAAMRDRDSRKVARA
jgi:hypothetical protein